MTPPGLLCPRSAADVAPLALIAALLTSSYLGGFVAPLALIAALLTSSYLGGFVAPLG
jgi:hypothetical protein